MTYKIALRLTHKTPSRLLLSLRTLFQLLNKMYSMNDCWRLECDQRHSCDKANLNVTGISSLMDSIEIMLSPPSFIIISDDRRNDGLPAREILARDLIVNIGRVESEHPDQSYTSALITVNALNRVYTAHKELRMEMFRALRKDMCMSSLVLKHDGRGSYVPFIIDLVTLDGDMSNEIADIRHIFHEKIQEYDKMNDDFSSFAIFADNLDVSRVDAARSYFDNVKLLGKICDAKFGILITQVIDNEYDIEIDRHIDFQWAQDRIESDALTNMFFGSGKHQKLRDNVGGSDLDMLVDEHASVIGDSHSQGKDQSTSWALVRDVRTGLSFDTISDVFFGSFTKNESPN